jgi:hypothetical protein
MIAAATKAPMHGNELWILAGALASIATAIPVIGAMRRD